MVIFQDVELDQPKKHFLSEQLFFKVLSDCLALCYAIPSQQESAIASFLLI